MQSKSPSGSTSPRGESVRQRILDAAEALLRQGKAAFSMRDLAAEAKVSFATPFNHFGGKAALMHALSGRRIDLMEARFRSGVAHDVAIDRVYFAVKIAVGVMLEEPVVNRAIMGWLGAAHSETSQVLNQSKALWALAVGDGIGLIAAKDNQRLNALPLHIALIFRGALSFWTAGDIKDMDLFSYANDPIQAHLNGLIIPLKADK